MYNYKISIIQQLNFNMHADRQQDHLKGHLYWAIVLLL